MLAASTWVFCAGIPGISPTVAESCFILTTVFAIVITLFICIGRKLPVRVRLNSIDISGVLFFIGICTDLILFSVDRGLLMHRLLICCACLGVYVLTSIWLSYRFITRRELPAIFFFLMTAQLGWGWMQRSGVFASGYLPLSATGPFLNPAPFAIYLASGLPILFSYGVYLKNTVRGKGRLLPLALCVSCAGTALVLVAWSDSRAAWIGLFVSLMSCGFLYSGKMIRWGILLFCLSFCFYFGKELYNYKKASADGRVLIWQISARLAERHPITGVGPGSFPAAFAEEQRLFFTSGVRGINLLTSGVRYAFNDYVQIFCETGAFGFFMFIFLILCLFSRIVRFVFLTHPDGKDRSRVIGISGAMIVLFVAAVFSYPLYMLPVCVELTILSSLISFCCGGKSYISLGRLSGPGAALVLCLLLTPGCSLAAAFEAGRLRSFNSFYRIVKGRAWSEGAIPEQEALQSLYPALHNEQAYRDRLCEALRIRGHYKKEIEVLEKERQIQPEPSTYYELGIAYEKTGNFRKAEEVYIYASETFPGLIRPFYYLAMLYLRNDDREKWLFFAGKVLSLHPKIASIEVEEMKNEIRRRLVPVR